MKIKLFLALLTAVAALSAIIISYFNSGIKTYPSYKTSSMQGFHLIHKENNEKKWELTAERAIFPVSTKEIILKGLNIRMLQGRELALKGGSGVYDINEKNLVISSPAAITMQGAELTSETLTWNGQKGILTTEKDIRLTDKNFLIEGTGLKADMKDQQVRILRNVKGTFYQ